MALPQDHVFEQNDLSLLCVHTLRSSEPKMVLTTPVVEELLGGAFSAVTTQF